MRTSGFEVPELEYCLEIDGKRVEMKQRLEDVGCVENSEVRVVTVTGESLDKHFSVKDKEEEDLPKDSSSKTMNENPVKAITKPVAGSESVETTPNADQNQQEPDPVEAA